VRSSLCGWWCNAVIYQIYPRSFADSDGDGVGDITGIISRLDYLEWLGIDAIWISPMYPSPNHDFGYDVADYLTIDPVFGTMADFDRLVTEAGRHRIRVVLDLVPNHTSSEHPWFMDRRKKLDYYVWADKPNNWISSLHIPSWTYAPDVGRFYLHSYLPEEPDLDWWNADVRAEFDAILRFWFDRGVAGFRIDACYVIVKDRLLRDNPPADPRSHLWDLNRGQQPIYNAHRPEVHDILRRWRRIADSYDPPRLLVGATWVPELEELATYYGSDDELHLPQYFQLFFCRFEADELRAAVEAWLAALRSDNVPVWAGSNHDLSRFPTRWCEGDESMVRIALTMLLTLPGACILFQGDEFGMEDTVVPEDRGRDTAPIPRDASRTPMLWNRGRHGGFTTGEPWLPVGQTHRNVQDQLADPDSPLNLTRRLIQLKKRLSGPYEPQAAGPRVWRYRRGTVTVELDFARREARVDG